MKTRTIVRCAIFFVIVAVALGFMFPENAVALNGTRMLGFSARDGAMAGATTASAADTSCMIKNPAGLVRIGNRLDMEYLNLLPHDVSMHTEGALSNAGKRQKSKINYLPGMDSGLSYQTSGIGDYPVAVGCGFFTLAGVAGSYAEPRLNPALGVGQYDRFIYLTQSRMTPAIAVGITDNFSIGLAANIGLSSLSTDMAFAASNGTYPETAGHKKIDMAVGGGFTAGILYTFNDMISIGAAYESKTFMSHFNKYKESFHLIDAPRSASIGFSFKPIKKLEITYDTRWINWEGTKACYRGPQQGGFGWQDQWVFSAGSEYTPNDKWKLRLGYNYGKSPIREKVIFANALLGVIMEHHLTAGLAYQIDDNWGVDLTWEHHFFNAMADSGAGDLYSRVGQGTKVTAAAEVVGIGISYVF
ncbi:MAG: outer membrane protein transport protein [Candidatus Omnitrophica bacterium]|nr:outer membrane protein transport protein [Candidatus Omnitrophota bacterium]MBU1128821.1 outer membrane protein transport protein [Candidatus Omnitrophota bacterium]MBU1783786.1 outer membrane protein transport protein [Candidatus Omnitrophota bacterium]